MSINDRFNLRKSCGIALVAASAAVLAACATGEPPVAQLATARESVRQAESAGAPQLAPVEMLAARDKLSRAEVASRDKHYAEAAQLTEEATADANLAERRARALKSRQAEQDLQQSNAVLANEVTRQAN
jgi:hypothetical protein